MKNVLVIVCFVMFCSCMDKHITKLEYAETDGRCCPSVKTPHTLTIKGNKAY